MLPPRAEGPSSLAFGRREAARLLAILGVAGFLFFVRLDGPLLEPEESLYAEIPREMLEHDRFLIPVLDGHDYLDKPPLLYWAVMACYDAFGVHVWSARLVPCLAAWFTVVVVYGWVRRSAGSGAAAAAAAVLILTGDFVYRGPMLTMNGLLGLFVVTALASGHMAVSAGKWRRAWWIASALACAAGVLTKGPVAAALVSVPLAALLWSGGYTGWRGMKILAGYLALVSLAAGPWFLAVAVCEPGFASYFFWRHHVERFLAPFDHAEPPWFYLPQVALGFFPWSLILALVALGWVRGLGRPSSRSVAWVGLAAAGWTLLLFSLSGSKRPIYLVPLWPMAAVVVGVRLHGVLSAGATAKVLGITGRGWRCVGGMTLAVLTGCVTVWLPAYAEQFSVPRQPVVELAGPAAAERPVCCYRYRRESVAFYLGRDNVETIRRGELPKLLGVLRRYPEAAVVFRSGPEVEEFIGHLPPELEFERRRQTAFATMGIVHRHAMGASRGAGGP